MGSGEGSLNQMTMSSGFCPVGGVVSHGSRALRDSRPDTLVVGTGEVEQHPGESERRERKWEITNLVCT